MPSIICRENDKGEVEYLSSISPIFAQDLVLEWSSKPEQARKFSAPLALAVTVDRLRQEEIKFTTLRV
jgi:hypothetical protein